MYWEREIETIGQTGLEVLQLKRLKQTLKRAKASLYYGKVFRQQCIRADTIQTLKDIEKIPLTTKDDLRDHWPYGFLAVSRDKLIRMHSSSGTTGRATVIFHTAHDIKEWTNIVARSMYMTGMRKQDVFQNMMTYGLFTGGLGFHYGAEKIGALTIPVGAGNSKRQIQLMRDFETTVIHIIPSYALHLTTVFEELDVNPRKDTKLKIAFVGAEPHSEKMRNKIEKFYGFKAFNSYGLSEMNGPGVAFECPAQNGLHIWEDNFFVEIIDPVTLKQLPDGEEGELVLTTLLRDGMPILRYRTKDLTRIIPGSCECGRTHRRIERIKGRTDDMMILKGVNIFPIQIEKKLMEIPGVGNNFLIILEREGFNDLMVIKVEVQKEFFAGDLKQLEALRRKIAEELRSDILITPKVDLVEPDSLPKSEGKAKRVIDNRHD
jgi:phenylacetate-CoA ligase